MSYSFRYIGVFFFLLLGNNIFAQQHLSDTVHHISGIEISSDRFSQTISGVKVEKIDSNSLRLFENSNLNDLLAQHSSLYIKSNGVSGLSSISIRGTGTSHTAILWNGFNIQNPMNAGMDISLIPVSFVNKISIQYNGMAALYGSGAIGGAIHLSNEPQFNKGFDLSIGSTYGSFANYSFNIKLGLSSKKAAISVKAFYHDGKNDFPFINYAKFGSPKVRQTNSEMLSYGIINDNAYKINEKNQLKLRVWLQESKRQIPPVMTQEFVNTQQNDDFLRTAIEWINKGKNYKLFVRSALLIDNYKYTDTDKMINSTSGTTASVSESEIYFKLAPFHTVNIGIHYKYTSGFCDYYIHKQSQQEFSVFGAYAATNKKDSWKLNIALREEYSNNSFLPLLPSIAMDIRLYKNLMLYFNFSRNYRIPTLNDLYWYPGGNPNLKPENGYAEEIGLKQQTVWNKVRFNYNVSGFNNNITNWIIWLPDSVYWSPQNIQSVWSLGAEANMGFDFIFNKWNASINSKFSYVRATTRKSNNPSAIGKQLIYTPMLNSELYFIIAYKKTVFSYNMAYVSTRYTSPDNSESIKPYLLGNIQITKQFQIKRFSIDVFCHLNNIWNTIYQTIVWQAMPGFNFNAGLQMNFTQTLKKLKKS
ncbi:MAG: TonB-dependent receptor [Bacteroidota bacterium]